MAKKKTVSIGPYFRAQERTSKKRALRDRTGIIMTGQDKASVDWAGQDMAEKKDWMRHDRKIHYYRSRQSRIDDDKTRRGVKGIVTTGDKTKLDITG